MKNYYLLLILCLGVFFHAKAQTTNDVLNLLISNKTITQVQADSIRADAAIKQQETDKNKKWFQVNAARLANISGYTQFRYQNLDEQGKIDGFDIRRARLDVKGNINSYWTYRLQTDFAVTPKIVDAFGECKISDFFIITLGQFKLPFSAENLVADNTMEMIDRSQVVEALVSRGKDVIGNQNGRDIGVQVGGSFLKCKDRTLMDYRVGVFNGNGVNGSDNNEAKDIVARLISHPVKGMDLGGSYFVGYDLFGTPAATNQNRTRAGLEMSYEIKQFNVKAEYIMGKDGKISRVGWFAQAGYFIIPQKFQFMAKYDTYDPDDSLPDNISTQYSAALNYYFNNWTRLQAAYTWKNEEGKSVVNNFGSIQFQISF